VAQQGQKKQNDENKEKDFATPAAARAIPVKPSTAAIKATTKKINAQRNILHPPFWKSDWALPDTVWFSKKKGNWTAVSLGYGQVQNHTAELVFYGRSLVSNS